MKKTKETIRKNENTGKAIPESRELNMEDMDKVSGGDIHAKKEKGKQKEYLRKFTK